MLPKRTMQQFFFGENQKISFLFSFNKNICCKNSLEVSHRDTVSEDHNRYIYMGNFHSNLVWKTYFIGTHWKCPTEAPPMSTTSSQAKGTKSTLFLTRKEQSGLSTLGLRRCEYHSRCLYREIRNKHLKRFGWKISYHGLCIMFQVNKTDCSTRLSYVQS